MFNPAINQVWRTRTAEASVPAIPPPGPPLSSTPPRPSSLQDAIFEDTKHLVQSAVDGYNVCIFAYGQVRPHPLYSLLWGSGRSSLSPSRCLDDSGYWSQS